MTRVTGRALHTPLTENAKRSDVHYFVVRRCAVPSLGVGSWRPWRSRVRRIVLADQCSAALGILRAQLCTWVASPTCSHQRPFAFILPKNSEIDFAWCGQRCLHFCQRFAFFHLFRSFPFRHFLLLHVTLRGLRRASCGCPVADTPSPMSAMPCDPLPRILTRGCLKGLCADLPSCPSSLQQLITLVSLRRATHRIRTPAEYTGSHGRPTAW